MIYLAIVGLTTLWFVVCGILNDQITIRICAEYFTIFHRPLVASTDITVIAAAWGIVASWWVGLLVGVAQAFIIRLLSIQDVDVRRLMRLGLRLTALTFGICIVAGVLGHVAATTDFIDVVYWFPKIPPVAQARFLAVLFWHNALYACAGFSGLILCVVIFKMGRRRHGAPHIFEYDEHNRNITVITVEDLQAIQHLLQELHDYGEAHANENWAVFVNTKVSEALQKLKQVDEGYIPYSNQTLAERYAYAKEQDAKEDMAERVRKLREPNSLFSDINGDAE